METPNTPDCKNFRKLKRVKLVEKVSKRSREIIELKKEINKLASISVLPPEILSEMFLCYVVSCEEQEENDEMVEFLSNDLRVFRKDHLDLKSRKEGWHDQSYDRPYYAFRVAQVCHHWREVALCSPRLWSRVVLVRSDDSSCVKEMLRRSQQAPLSVRVNSDQIKGDLNVELLKSMFQDMHRIQSIVLTIEERTRNIGDLLHSLFHKDAPMLQSISMDYCVSSLDNCPPLFLPSHNLSRLIRLSIFTNRLDHAAPLFRASLKHFVFDSIYEPVPYTTILSLLAGMPLLETLRIVDGVMGPRFSPEPIIELSHLQLLQIHCPIAVCVYLLKRLSFPSSTSIQLNCDWDDFMEYHRQVVPALMSRQAEYQNNNPDDESKSDRLDLVSLCCSEQSLQFRTYTRNSLPSRFSIYDLDECTPKLSVELKTCLEGIQVVEELCICLPLTGVRTLIIGDTRTWSQYRSLSISHATWEKIFGRLLNLHLLVAFGNSADALPAVLRQMKTVGVESGMISEELLCPRLKSVELLSVMFKSYYTLFPDNFFDRLVESLKYRKESGMKLARLGIKHAINLPVRLGEMEELRQTVEEVKLDGAEIYDVDEEDELLATSNSQGQVK